jgi:CheY-like chemotaxis protein
MGNVTILAVDDSQAIRSLIVETLEPLGYKVIVAASGQEALEICRAKKEKIDLLLADVVMPGMSGRQLTKKLQEVCPSLKILLMSGYPADIVGPNSQLEPHLDFISKPFKLDVLSQKINQILKKSSGDADEK